MDRMRGLWNAAHSERMQSPGDTQEMPKKRTKMCLYLRYPLPPLHA